MWTLLPYSPLLETILFKTLEVSTYRLCGRLWRFSMLIGYFRYGVLLLRSITQFNMQRALGSCNVLGKSYFVQLAGGLKRVWSKVQQQQTNMLAHMRNACRVWLHSRALGCHLQLKVLNWEATVIVAALGWKQVSQVILWVKSIWISSRCAVVGWCCDVQC